MTLLSRVAYAHAVVAGDLLAGVLAAGGPAGLELTSAPV